MPRMLLTVRYIGTDYCGWQVQKNGVAVQEKVQDALEKVLGNRIGLTGCSRTDSGVHALAFCAHLDADFKPELLPKALNFFLPMDITVTNCKAVAPDFHARYDAKGKTYRYKLLASQTRDPFFENRAWRWGHKLDFEFLNRCCTHFIGKYDFAAFCSAGSKVENTVRTVSECYAEREGDIVSIVITADGFLYNMVRIIVGTLMDIQSGKINEEDIIEIIKSKKRENAGVTAPARGLYLEKVHY